MSLIRIKINKVNFACQDLKTITNKLSYAKDNNNRLLWQLDNQILRSNNIDSKIRSLNDDFDKIIDQINSFRNLTSFATSSYENIDKIINQRCEKIFGVVKKNLLLELGSFIYDTGVSTVIHVSESVSDLYESLQTGGDLYNTRLYVGVAVKGSLGLVKAAWSATKIATAITAVVATGGLAIPVAAVVVLYEGNKILHAGNDVINAANDFAYIKTEQYNMVGQTNALRDASTYIFGEIGELFGDKNAGERFGSGFYNFGNIVDSVGDIAEGVKIFDPTPKLDYAQLGVELENLPSNIWKLSNTNVGEVVYQAKLLSYEIPNTIKAAKSISTFVEGVIDLGTEFKDSLDSIFLEAGFIPE